MKPQKRNNKLATVFGALLILIIGGIVIYSVYVLAGSNSESDAGKAENGNTKIVQPGTHQEIESLIRAKITKQSPRYGQAVDKIAEDARSIDKEREAIEGVYDASRF